MGVVVVASQRGRDRWRSLMMQRYWKVCVLRRAVQGDGRSMEEEDDSWVLHGRGREFCIDIVHEHW